MARSGRFSNPKPSLDKPTAKKPTVKKSPHVTTNEAGGLDAEQGASTASSAVSGLGTRERFTIAPAIKYMIFGVVTLFFGILVAGAVVAWLGTVLATMSNVDANTSLLTMLDSWFFPMLTLSILAALMLFAGLRRFWHSLEKRFG